MTGFGQLVIGPPGAGKTTYCNGLQHYFTLTGRPCAVVNLDPANHAPPYECAVSIEELISLEEVQTELNLGPNGAMVYCMEYVAKNLDWLVERVTPLVKEGKFLLFDLPGQVELFTSHDAVKQIIAALVCNNSELDLRLCTVHLVDGHLCADPSKYISALMVSLQSMLHLETPHVNVLSKIDLMDKYGDLDFSLEYYADVQDLKYLADRVLGEDALNPNPNALNPGNSKVHPGTSYLKKRYGKLTKDLCELVEDFGLVNFVTLAIEDKDSVTRLVQLTDKCVGYVSTQNSWFSRATSQENPSEYAEPGTFDERQLISHAPALSNYERHMEVQERYFKDPDAFE